MRSTFPKEPRAFCLFGCLFVGIKPEILYFNPCVWREVIIPGNGCTLRRTHAQTTCVRRRQRHKPCGMFVCLYAWILSALLRSSRALYVKWQTERDCAVLAPFACMLVCLDSVYTLDIITRPLREVVNRERLCCTSAFYFGGFRNS